MNMRLTFRYVLLSVLLAGSAGCNKWLDVKPKTQVGEKDLLVDEQGFKDALIGTYTDMGDEKLYGREFTMALLDVLAANYDVAATSHTYNKAGLYDYVDGTVKLKLAGFWSQAYKCIANLNNLLDKIDAKKEVFNTGMYELVKGEALALRAFLHFDMLRAFGPVPATGLDNPAIPYVTKFNMQVQPKLTTKQVVAKCMDDLKAAQGLLAMHKDVVLGHSDIFLAHTRNHMNYWAVTGLMARVSLYGGDRQNAYAYATEVIAGGRFPWIRNIDISSIYPNRIFSYENIFALYVSNLQDINLVHFRGISATTAVLTNKAAFINNRFEISSGGSTDIRYLHLWKTDGSSSTKYPVKYWMEDLLASNGIYIRRVPILRLTEMYYIAAEAAGTTLEGVRLLNTVRANRGLQQLSESLSGDQLQTEIMKEYKKEFIQEGQLFFYYKRTNAKVLEGTGKPGNDALYVLPLPDDEVEFNQN
ncbi:RagB/SusD family nutrient uptake outer membrane protein [Chitinophaga sp.]|uniref:RagB/SusD family nutrient uptake outer membrane protein n=1 Tax=Chitinophaga sp. TaxID=1869181 RepID=UPI002613E28D|nr:RagB/SusD family nutrient uptake outer membrane protein [uncultured Chitinophaga sp.]